MSLRRYTTLEDSGVEWLGEVPSHWRITRLKNLFDLMNRLPQAEDEIVTAFRDGEVTLRRNRRIEGFTNAIHEHGYQRIHAGDLVIHAMDAFAGAIGVSDSAGKATPVYAVCKPKSSAVNARYYGYLLRHMALSGFVNALSKGIRERSTEFRWKEASNVLVAAPPSEEQQAIISFLDVQVGQIEQLIDEQRRLIELLKEKRLAVISHAVSKGLNPVAPMKASDVEWLGDVPVHWTVVPLGALCAKIGSGKTPLGGAESYVSEGVLFVRSQNVYDEGLRLDDVVYIPEIVDEEMRSSRVETGDILLNITGASLGRTCIVPEGLPRANVNQHVCILRLTESGLRRYVAMVLKSSAMKAQFDAAQNGAAREGLNYQQIARLVLAIPPENERREILKVLLREIPKNDALVSETERVIVLLQERREALISAAVTGKIDVRHLADAEAA